MWNSYNGEVQGRGHERNGLPCQDKTMSMSFDGVDVVALADGAGSASLSHYGAEASVKCVCQLLAESFERIYGSEDGAGEKVKLLEAIGHSLEQMREELSCETKDLASTLLVVAIKDDRFILAHLGDGVIGYMKNGSLKVATRPENGEFANTTVFTTSSGAARALRLLKGKLNGIEGFVLMSDGPEACLYRKRDGQLAEGLKAFMLGSRVIQKETVQNRLRKDLSQVVRERTQDDCSLAFLVDDRDFPGYSRLEKNKRKAFLGLRRETSGRVLSHYDDLLGFLSEEGSPEEAFRKAHMKPRYAGKYLQRLIAQGYLEKGEDGYRTVLRM